MTSTRVLVVDDEAPIIELVCGYLEREGMEVIAASDGQVALDLIRERAPDVVVLDVNLPGLDGFEVLRRARAFSDAYVIMLTARAEEIDRIVGLSVGADDYLVKPFSPRELVARIRALLRRPRMGTAPGGEAWQVGDLAVDPRRRAVTLRGSPVLLTAIEFELLATLIREPGVVLGRQQLLDRAWGADYVGDEHVVDVHLANLRRKLGDDAARPLFIETVRGVGYRFKEAT
ncbi:MAG: response regulator transcription factor [Candidatus Limnocylindrales bacterium]|nr:response regulator transcription factor [Candidatus Limnocylindrales bacterium]